MSPADLLSAAFASPVVLALGWTLVLAAVTWTLYYLPRVAHDTGELAGLVLRSANAGVRAAARCSCGARVTVSAWRRHAGWTERRRKRCRGVRLTAASSEVREIG